MDIHKTGDGFVVADQAGWLPGIYDTEETARQAARLPGADLEGLAHIWRVDGENRPATMDDLSGLAWEVTPAETLAAIAALARGMRTMQDEYAVGLAADVLAVIDGAVTADEIMAESNKRPVPGTVGEALDRARKLHN